MAGAWSMRWPVFFSLPPSSLFLSVHIFHTLSPPRCCLVINAAKGIQTQTAECIAVAELLANTMHSAVSSTMPAARPPPRALFYQQITLSGDQHGPPMKMNPTKNDSRPTLFYIRRHSNGTDNLETHRVEFGVRVKQFGLLHIV